MIDRLVDQGTLVGPDTSILSLETVDQPLEGVPYIPAGDGKKVQPGMTVRVSDRPRCGRKNSGS